MDREWRFRIYPTRLGFWRWYATGHGVFNVSYPSSHLPRRSRRACEEAARSWVQRKRDDTSKESTLVVP